MPQKCYTLICFAMVFHLLCFAVTSWAQKTHPGDLQLRTQDEVENKFDDYEEVIGNLIIGDPSGQPSDINDLSKLKTLSYVGENLVILGNVELSNLDGLNNIISIGTSLTIKNNPLLGNCCSIRELVTHLEQVGTLIQIQGSGTNCADVAAILNSCPDESSVDQPADQFQGDLVMENQAKVNELFKDYREITGNLTIGTTDNPFSDITDLSKLTTLEAVGGDLKILVNLKLTSLESLRKLQSIGGSLEISGNMKLENLSGLEGLRSIGKRLYIEQNHQLTSIAELERLTTIGGDIMLYDNYMLTNLPKLKGFTTLKGKLVIFGSKAFTGLEDLESVEGDVMIYDVNEISGLATLEGLSSIGGDLKIDYNNNLANLEGLEQLTFIGGNLIISENYRLSSLKGLMRLNSIGGDLEIYSNSQLKACCSIDALLKEVAEGKTVSISGNGVNCSSKEEILNSCRSKK